MNVYQVANWNGNFENNKSRGYDRCTFVCVPNKLDGMGLRWILKEPDGPAVYGMFHLILCRCSKQRKPRDGWLTENGQPDGTPLTADDLAAMFGRPVAEVERAFDVLASPRIGWIARHQVQDAGADSARKESTQQKGYIGTALEVPVYCPSSALTVPSQCLRTELNGTEQKDGNGRLHSTHQVPTTTTETHTAGAPRPSCEKLPRGNGNDNSRALPPAPQANTPDGKIPLQDYAKQATTTQASTSTPPAADRATGPNQANAKASQEANQTPPNPPQDARADRPADVQDSLSRLGELLRRGGWIEHDARRVLKWLIGWKRGAWIRKASEGDYWQVAAHSNHIKATGKARDAVSVLISQMDKGAWPPEEHYRKAKTDWLALDHEDERIEPIWMREILAGIATQPEHAEAQRRTIADVAKAFGIQRAAGA